MGVNDCISLITNTVVLVTLATVKFVPAPTLTSSPVIIIPGTIPFVESTVCVIVLAAVPFICVLTPVKPPIEPLKLAAVLTLSVLPPVGTTVKVNGFKLAVFLAIVEAVLSVTTFLLTVVTVEPWATPLPVTTIPANTLDVVSSKISLVEEDPPVPPFTITEAGLAEPEDWPGIGFCFDIAMFAGKVP